MLPNDTHQYRAEPIDRATELIRLGARMHLAESEDRLRDEQLLKLLEEVGGERPRADVPFFPAKWFLEWQPNVHATLFVGIWSYLGACADLHGIEAITRCRDCGTDFVVPMERPASEPICSLCQSSQPGSR